MLAVWLSCTKTIRLALTDALGHLAVLQALNRTLPSHEVHMAYLHMLACVFISQM